MPSLCSNFCGCIKDFLSSTHLLFLIFLYLLIILSLLSSSLKFSLSFKFVSSQFLTFFRIIYIWVCSSASFANSLLLSSILLLFVFCLPSERRSGSHALVVCSALKRLYRQILLYGSKALTSSSCADRNILPATPDVFFLFLHGDYDLLYQRMVARRGHYMKADLLRSQFDVLEPPLDEENVLPLDVRRNIPDMAKEVEKHVSFRETIVQ